MDKTIVLSLASANNDGSVSLLIRSNVDSAIKSAAEYYSADFLEDMDMFDWSPGWYIGATKVAELIAQGYAAQFDGVTYTDAAIFRNYFAPTTVQARIQAAKDAQVEAKRKAEEEKARIAVEREAAGVAYDAWRGELTSGLVSTTLSYPGTHKYERVIALEWQIIRNEPGTTPTAWFDGGDRWQSAKTPDGATIYKRSYGNASVIYLPEAMAQQWAMNYWNEILEDVDKAHLNARSILQLLVWHEDGKPVYGDQDAKRIVDAVGLDTVVGVASRTMWFVETNNGDYAIAKRFGIPHIAIKYAKDGIYQSEDGRKWRLAGHGHGNVSKYVEVE